MRQAVAAIARFTVIGCHRLVKWPAEKWPLVADFVAKVSWDRGRSV